jgi:hypothetical protein
MGWFDGRGHDGTGGSTHNADPPAPPAATTTTTELPPPPPAAPLFVDAARELVAPQPFATPTLEPQPWAKDLWRTLASTSVGVARLDLRRPDFLDVDSFDSRNLLYTRPGAVRRGPGRPRRNDDGAIGGLVAGFLGGGGGRRGRGGGDVPAFVIDAGGDGGRRRLAAEDDYYYDGGGRGGGGGGGGGQMGARLKIMRCWHLRPKGNDLEGARRVDEALRRLGRRAGGWWPFSGGGGGAGGASGSGSGGGELRQQRHALGLELVPQTAATSAAELFGQDDGEAVFGGGGGGGGGGGSQRQQDQTGDPKKFSLRAPRPLFDFGLGASLNLDASRLEPVARLKIAGLVSVHLAGGRGGLSGPRVKIGRVFRVPGSSIALRLRYECPLGAALSRPWEPPARLLLRLDNGVGSGVHLSPGGLEFAERRVALGDNLAVRAGATVLFPRPGGGAGGSYRADADAGALKVRVHRLSVKSLW